MCKARRIGKFAEQSGPELLRARHRENDEKNIATMFTRPRNLNDENTIKMHACYCQLIDH